MAKVVAFVSYAHADEVYVEGEIVRLARRLELALRAFTGRNGKLLTGVTRGEPA